MRPPILRNYYNLLEKYNWQELKALLHRQKQQYVEDKIQQRFRDIEILLTLIIQLDLRRF